MNRMDAYSTKRAIPLISATFSSLTLLNASSLSAQTNPADDQLEEVVVTAQKRPQSLQTVGIAINTLKGKDLEALGISNSNQIAEKVPNLTIVSPSGEGGVVSAFIRGIGLNDFALNNAGPVGYYVDGSLISSTNAQLTSLFDIEQVEVLKGPQGTLFGRNTTGGAINIISNKPTSTFENTLTVGIDRFSNHRTEGMVSGRINNTANGRLAITSARSGGYIENLSNGDTVERDNLAARALLDIKMSEHTKVLLNIHGSKLDGDSDLYGNTNSINNDFYASEYGNQSYTLDVESSGLSAQVEWALNNHMQLVSVTSFDHLGKRQDEDLDTLPLQLIEFEYNADIDTLAQELRLQGKTNAIDWVTGLYFLKEDNQWLMNLNLSDLPIDPVNFPGLSFGRPVLDGDQALSTAAAFGQLEYQWSSAWNLVLGLRYTELTVDFNFDADAPNLAFVTPATGILSGVTFSDELTNRDISGKAAINFTPNSHSLYYASLTRGFKGGGFNGGVVNDFNNYPARAKYDPETLTAYELGTKWMLLDNSLRLNMAAFYYDYQDAQVYNSTVDPIFGIAQNVVENADTLELYGLDIDLTWQASQALFLQAGLGYTHSEFSKYLFSVPTRISEPLAVDIAGETPQNTPELNLNLLGRYTWALGDAGQLVAQADVAYQSKIFFSNGQMLIPGDTSSYDRNEALGQPGYTLWNARLSWARADEKLEVGLWGKNLSDKQYQAYMVELSQFFGFDQVIRGVPRNVGIDVRYHF